MDVNMQECVVSACLFVCRCWSIKLCLQEAKRRKRLELLDQQSPPPLPVRQHNNLTMEPCSCFTQGHTRYTTLWVWHRIHVSFHLDSVFRVHSSRSVMGHSGQEAMKTSETSSFGSADGQMVSSLTLENFTEKFRADLMTARCPGPVAAEQAQIIIPTPLCFTVDMRCLAFSRTGCHSLRINIRSVNKTLYAIWDEILRPRERDKIFNNCKEKKGFAQKWNEWSLTCLILNRSLEILGWCLNHAQVFIF